MSLMDFNNAFQRI